MRLCLAVAAALAVAGCQGPTVKQPDTPGPAPPAPVAADPASAAGKPVSAGRPAPVAPVQAPAVITPGPALAPAPVARRIALLLPLSGQNAGTGASLLNAAQLALFETAEDDLELLVFDTRGSIAGATEAGRAAVAAGAGLILGPLFGTSADAVNPIAAAAGLNVISFSNNPAVAGNGTYVFGFQPEQQIRRIVSFATARGHSNFAILAPLNEFGVLAVEAAHAAIARQGGSLTRITEYDPDEADLSDVVRAFADYDNRKSALAGQRAFLREKSDPVSRRALQRLAGRDTLEDLPFDSVIIPSGGAELRRLAPLLAYYDVDPGRVKLLGTALWDSDGGLATEPALLGGWYAASAPEMRMAFAERYQQAFGSEPARLAILSYDAMLLAVALSYVENGPDYSTAALTDVSGFSGAGGIVRLLGDGTNQRGLAVLEIQGGAAHVIDPAPATFEDLGY